VADPQIVRVQAGLPHRLNDCCCHPEHTPANTTDQLIEGVQPLLVAVNVVLPHAPSGAAAYQNETVAPPAGMAMVRQSPLVLFAAPPQAPPPSPE